METQSQDRKLPMWKKKWIRNMGMGAFLFFFIKGLIWLAIFFGLFSVLGC